MPSGRSARTSQHHRVGADCEGAGRQCGLTAGDGVAAEQLAAVQELHVAYGVIGVSVAVSVTEAPFVTGLAGAMASATVVTAAGALTVNEALAEVDGL